MITSGQRDCPARFKVSLRCYQLVGILARLLLTTPIICTIIKKTIQLQREEKKVFLMTKAHPAAKPCYVAGGIPQATNDF
jgi:hypothetical protein